MDHVIESQQFDRRTVESIFATADSLIASSKNSLEGKILASLFYEPSTRTRFSFESAMLKLGGKVISTENAAEFSSAAKGEVLEDSIRVIDQYADVIVLRHPESGAAERSASVSAVPVINAGDGAGQHPTQALLDLYTIQKEFGQIDGTNIALVGDLQHGRTVRSLSYLLGKYDDISVTFVSPEQLRMGADIKKYLSKHKVSWKEETKLENVLSTVDIVYMTRIQKERFAEPREYEAVKDVYTLTLEEVAQMKTKSIIMHPLPRTTEIAKEVDASPKAVYFNQAEYGLFIRMALLEHLLL